MGIASRRKKERINLVDYSEQSFDLEKMRVAAIAKRLGETAISMCPGGMSCKELSEAFAAFRLAQDWWKMLMSENGIIITDQQAANIHGEIDRDFAEFIN